MAKKQDDKKAVKATKLARTVENRARRLARHAKRHPNDLQPIGEFSPRRTPRVKGNFASPNRAKFYRDTITGQPLVPPLFDENPSVTPA